MIEHVFESAAAPSVLDDDWLQGALAELTERWRAAADADEPTRRTADGAARLTASFEAGALHLQELRAAQAMIGAQEACRARAIAAFCRSRPASLDRPAAEVGAAAAATRAARPSALAAVSEWAVDEVAVTLSLTEAGASRVVVMSVQLVERLPGTLAALARGALTWEHARVMCEVVAPLDDTVRGQAEQRLLSRLGTKTPPQLRAAAHRVVARLDADAIGRRVADAIRERKITVHPAGDGLGSLSVSGLPLPVVRAAENALQQYADAAAPGDERTRTQRMLDCLIDRGCAPVRTASPPSRRSSRSSPRSAPCAAPTTSPARSTGTWSPPRRSAGWPSHSDCCPRAATQRRRPGPRLSPTCCPPAP